MRKSTCTAPECERPVKAKGYCNRHYQRLWQGKPMSSRTDLKPKRCDIEGCDKWARSRTAEHCEMHYYRNYIYGDPGEAEERQRKRVGEQCVADGCTKPDIRKGYCSMHGTRLDRHGDANRVVPPSERKYRRGERHPRWVGDSPRYSALHMRLRKYRGPASSETCADCGGSADEWSYNYADPAERYEHVGGYVLAYSIDMSNYDPRCRMCHIRFDSNQRRTEPKPPRQVQTA